VRGWDSVSVPGCVAAWVDMHARFGKLPFEKLFEAAIRYGRGGFMVSPTIARQWAAQTPELKVQPGFAEAFLPGGRPPAPGEVFKWPDHAGTLEKIAVTRGKDFYSGAIAEKIEAHAKQHNAAMRVSDLAAHRNDWVGLLEMDYRGYTVHEIPPNGQGITALQALGILREFDLRSDSPDSLPAQHRAIEAMKLAFADAYAHVADRDHMRVSPEALLDRAYLASRARLIDMKRAQDFGPGEPPRGGTVYLATGDADGTMVSLIQSNYMGFGSGVVVPGTGISLQNRGAGFSLEPGHPNVLAGGKRPFQTIIPGFLTRGGAPLAAFGVMGGPIQPQGHVQTLVRMLDHGMNAQAALDAPRWRWNREGTLDLEPSFDRDVRAGLAALGHNLVQTSDSYFDFGAGQFVVKLDDGYLAASDPRRDGQAAGF
jgi:gamma-glutamyltranspeptidase/glutathione hydrolase